MNNLPCVNISGWGNGVGKVFLLITIEHLNDATYLSIDADHTHPFMVRSDPSYNGYTQPNNVLLHKWLVF